MRPPANGQKGATVLETVLALGLVAMMLPALLTGLASLITSTDHAYDRSLALELAQSQMEEVQRQSYQESTADAYSLISAPAGYSISVEADDVQEYEYPDPKGVPTQETVQLVIVTVTGVRGNLSLQAYKVRR